MDKIFNDTIREVLELSFQNDLKRIAELEIENISYQLLTEEGIDKLVSKINLLPLEYRNILFLKYCFANTPSETDRVLGIENSKGKSRYVQEVLSKLLCLNNLWIDDNSMKKACDIAIREDIKKYDYMRILHRPNYSKKLRRELKNIGIEQGLNDKFRRIAKRVAILILVWTLIFSTVLTVNAEIREKVFDWTIEVFDNFTIFTPQKIDGENKTTDLTLLSINYIPDGFNLRETHKGNGLLIYIYSKDNGQEFDLSLSNLSTINKTYYDTEGVEVEEIIFKGHQAYTWESDDISYLVWYQDDIECHIRGNVSIDEFLKIAGSISK